MTNLRQDRVPDQTLSQGSVHGGYASAEGKAPTSTRSIVLAIRLWTQDSNGQPVAVSWQSTTPAVSLALDLVTASGGAPEPAPGTILCAGFDDAQSALLTVRRLQWALEGLADGSESRRVAVAMLIRSSEDALGEPNPNALENAAPGQVLLSSTIAESVNQLPNVALRGTGHDGLVEMQWRSSETELSSVADEQSVLRLIRELGREDPVAPELQAPTSTSAQTSQTPTSTMATGSFSTGRAHVEDDSALAGRKKKWLMIGGAAAAVVLAGILIMVLGHHAATPPAASPNATTRQVEQATPAGGTAASAPDTSDKAESTKSAEQKSSRTAEKASKAKAETAQTAALGSCDLTEGEIPRSLARAESYLHDGRLSDAQDVYKHLAGCPSARQRAMEGLQLVKQRIAASSSAQ